MTQDFKDKLLEYFTGNFQEGTTSYNYYQSNIETNANNLYTYLSGEIGNQYTGDFDITGVIQAKTPNDVNINIHILYGFSVGSTRYAHDYGFIVLIDDNFNVLELITEYTSGTPLGDFGVLNVDEEGYLYGIETNYNSTQKRFIMLNNVALKLPSDANYYAKIRRTYNLPAGVNDAYFNLIKKEPNGATYIMAGITYVGGIATPIAEELEIIVGASNNWTTYNYTGGITLTGTVTYDLWASWTGGNLDFQILGLDNNYACLFSKNGSNLDITRYSISGSIFSFTGKILKKYGIIMSYITSDFSTYLQYTIEANYGGIDTLIYQETGSYFGTTSAATCEVLTNGLEFYYTIALQQSASDYNFQVGRIIPKDNYNYDIIPTYNVVAQSDARYHYNYLFISQESNLYTWYLQVEDEAYIVKQTFNVDDYLAGGINNTEFFIPKYSNLYNLTDLIFSKNLYNLSVNDNITTATVEIPNTMLNNTSITNENLFGSTYEELVNGNVTFTKNEYETVDINFINTLNMLNKNNETITETDGANRLNDSISQTNDYSDARMTKYRINYADETTSVNSNTWYLVSNFYRTDLSISVTKEIVSIDFLSEDENTVYTTIYPELEVGKDYTISQDVYIEPKRMADQVYYNTDEVYYGSDEVYY